MIKLRKEICFLLNLEYFSRIMFTKKNNDSDTAIPHDLKILALEI